MHILSIFFRVAIFCFILNLQKQLQKSCSEKTCPCRPSFNGWWSPVNMLLAGFNVFYLRGRKKKKKCINNVKHHVRLTVQWKHMHGVCGNHCKIVRQEHPHTLTSSHTLFFIKIVLYLWLKSTSLRVKIRTKITVFDMICLCAGSYSAARWLIRTACGG